MLYNAEHMQNEVQIEPPTPVHDELPTTVHRLARELGVGKGAIYAAIDRGEMPSFRVGNMVRVLRSKVPAYLTDRWGGLRVERQVWPTGPLVYFLAGIPGFVKIGYTSDLERRVVELQPGSPVALRLLAHVPEATFAVEREYHRRFHAWRACGEWFTSSSDILAEIERLSA